MAGFTPQAAGRKAEKNKPAPTKRGIENFLTNPLLEVRPMRIDKLQMRTEINTVDEWLSETSKRMLSALSNRGASKNEDYIILAISSG